MNKKNTKLQLGSQPGRLILHFSCNKIRNYNFYKINAIKMMNDQVIHHLCIFTCNWLQGLILKFVSVII